MADNMSIIFPLIGTALGGFIGYFTAVNVSDRKEMQKAGIDFYGVIQDALISLDQRFYCREELERRGHGEIYKILNRTFPQQIKAMLIFRLHLPYYNRRKFDEAWKEYCHYDISGGPEFPFLEKYFDNTWKGQNTRKLALKNIYRLLSFVEFSHKSPFDTDCNG